MDLDREMRIFNGRVAVENYPTFTIDDGDVESAAVDLLGDIAAYLDRQGIRVVDLMLQVINQREWRQNNGVHGR